MISLSCKVQIFPDSVWNVARYKHPWQGSDWISVFVPRASCNWFRGHQISISEASCTIIESIRYLQSELCVTCLSRSCCAWLPLACHQFFFQVLKKTPILLLLFLCFLPHHNSLGATLSLSGIVMRKKAERQRHQHKQVDELQARQFDVICVPPCPTPQKWIGDRRQLTGEK